MSINAFSYVEGDIISYQIEDSLLSQMPRGYVVEISTILLHKYVLLTLF